MKLSLRTRTALLSSLASAVALAGFAWAALGMIHHQQVRSLDAEIRAFAGRWSGRGGGGGMQRLEQTAGFVFGGQEAKILVRDSAGGVLFRSESWPLPESQPSPAVDDWPLPEHGPAWQMREIGFSTQRLPSGGWRVGELAGRDRSVVVALPLAAVEERMRALTGQFLVLGLTALALVAAASWMMAGYALRPLANIASASAEIVGGQWARRIEPAPDSPEIDRLIDSLNRMLDHLDAARRQAGRFSADVSHELKTPLAVIQAAIEEALAGAEPGGREEKLCLDLMEELARIKAIIANLLLLARIDAGKLTPRLEAFDLPAEIRSVADDCASTRPDVPWSLESGGVGTILSDRPLCATILRNVVGNAFKFSPSHRVVRLTLAKSDHAITLVVANSGEPIPATAREQIFERFGRGEGERLPGQGLGLALARESARVLGGDVLLLEHQQGEIRFQIEWPQTECRDPRAAGAPAPSYVAPTTRSAPPSKQSPPPHVRLSR